MAIATLTIDIVAKLANLQSSFDKAAHTVQAGAKRMDSALKFVGTSVAGLGASLAPAILLSSFKALVGAIDDLDEAAQGLGTTAVELAGFRRAAIDSGVGAEKFDAALTKLNVKLADAQNGSVEAASLFKALGIATSNAAGDIRESGDVLRDVADAFARMKDGPDKARLAVELFGKAGAKMIPLLNGGGDALNRFTGLTDETVAAARKMQTEFDKFGASVDELKFKIAGGLLPAMNDFIEKSKNVDFIEALKRGNPAAIIANLVVQYGRATAAQNELKTSVEETADAYRQEGSSGYQSAAAVLARAKAFKEAAEAAEEAKKKAASFMESLKKRATTADLGEFQALRLEAAQLGVTKAAEKYVAQLERAAELKEELAEFDRATAAYLQDRTAAADFTRSLLEGVAAMQAEVDMIGRTEMEVRKLTAAREIDAKVAERIRANPDDAVRAEAEGAEAKRQANLRIEQQLTKSNAVALQDILDEINLETAAVGKSNAERQRAILLRDLEKKGIKEGTEEWAAAVAKINQIGVAIAENESMQIAQDRIDGVAASVANMVGEFTKTGDIKSFFENLQNYLLDLMTQILVVEPLARALREAMSPNATSGGGSGDMWGAVATAIGGFIGGARADGGPVRGGVPYLVGERGREIFVPRSDGQIIPNNKIGSMGRSTNIVVNLPPDTPGGSRTANQVAAEVSRQLANSSRRLN